MKRIRSLKNLIQTADGLSPNTVSTPDATVSLSTLEILSASHLQETIENVNWSAYKYACVLSLCEEDGIPADQANEALKKLPGFQHVSKVIANTAFLDIILSEQEKTYGLGLLEMACKAFYQYAANEAIEIHPDDDHDLTDPDMIFTHADDFDDVSILMHALNMMPLAYWPRILALPGMQTHLTFSFGAAYDMVSLVNILDVDSMRQSFLAQPGMLEALMNGLPIHERRKVVADYEVIAQAFCELMKTRVMQNNYVYNSSDVPDDELSDIRTELSNKWHLFLSDLDPALIKRLLKKYNYHELIFDKKNAFQDLLILLRADEPENRITALTNRYNLPALKMFRWGSYKYAKILDLCRTDTMTHRMADTKLAKLSPLFEVISDVLGEKAFEPEEKDEFINDNPKGHEADVSKNHESANDKTKSEDAFKKLINLLRSVYDGSRIRILVQAPLQDLLKDIHWSASKYALILDNCVSDNIKCEAIDTITIYGLMPVFKNVSPAMQKTALNEIIKPMDEERRENPDVHFHIDETHSYSCKAYSRALDQDNNEQTIFTHADDFPDIHSLIEALGQISQRHWPKLFALPSMDAHLLNLIQTDIDTSLITFELSDKKCVNALLGRPNVLETILNGLSIEKRWLFIAENDQAFIERIGQGRGDEILDLMGDCPDIGIDILRTVHEAAKQGYEKLKETRGVSSAQYINCKFNFFSPQTPHPFLEKLEKKITAKNGCKL